MPKTTVAAIVRSLDGTDRILLTRRAIDPFKGYWCLPGGQIEPFEPAKSAVVREVKEETGLDFEAAFFNYFDEIIPDAKIHAVVIAFSGPGRGTLAPQQDEVTEIGWFSLNEARSLPLAFTHNEIVEQYIIETRISSG